MSQNDLKRLSRITAILMWLQTKRVVTASELAEKFSVSVRTIYRDIRALERAGIPVLTEEGLGYSLMDGFRIPPVMFTESEAYALITAEQIVSRSSDSSITRSYKDALVKVKAVLKQPIKEKASLLQDRILVSKFQIPEPSSHHLSALQVSLTNSRLVKLTYANEQGSLTERVIEPFAFYATRDAWLLFAYCRLRNDFRAFRLDRMSRVQILTETFTSQTMSLNDFFSKHYAHEE